jgi:predicted aspartyl protease
MAVVFNYVGTESPPAPYVLVSIGRPDGTTITNDIPAKVDSGADRTVLPKLLVEQLRLDEVEQREFAGLGGHRVSMAIVRVLITIKECTPLEVNAASTDGEPYILLGRDVLNTFRIVLDGPNRKLEVS